MATNIRVEPLEDAIVSKMEQNCRSPVYPAAGVRIYPSGCAHTSLYESVAQRFRDFEVRENDVWVVSYPKCGTTWTQEMVWLIINDLDFGRAKKLPLNDRVPFFESQAIASMPISSSSDILSSLSRMTSRRIMKTHLPKELMPLQVWSKQPKVIYVARNPKDALVSYYHHHRLWNGYAGSFEDFFEAFLADVLVYSPFWDHVLDYWRIKDEPNVLFNTFEEMKRDLRGVISRTARFLNKTLTEEQVEELADHLSFHSMKSNPAVNLEKYAQVERERFGLGQQKNLQFIRKGECGSWKNEMTQEMADRIDAWTKKKLRGTGYDLTGDVQINGIANGNGHA